MTSFIPTPTGDLAGPTDSLWLAGAPATAYPALNGDAAFDVAVIGGGIAGVSTALALTALPHLGCLLHFNAAERSWDCPCHGSRFDIDGAVLAGPAVHPLERRDAS